MDACDPGVNSEDLKTLLKQKLGIDLKLSRNEICDVYSSIQDGKLPLPPLVLSRDRTHMMDRKSPLTMSDFDKLFSSSTKVTSIRRIAKKVGVARHADKKLTKAQLIGIIGRRLHALKVYEPIKFYSTQKTKIIRESINSFDNERNENNVNRGGRRNNNERNENNVNRSGRRNNNERNENNVNRGDRRNNNERNENNVNRGDRRNNNERNENNVNRGDRRNNNERNENRSPKFSKKRPFFLKRTSGPYVNVEKNAIKTQFNKLNRALFGEKTNDEQDEFERLSKIRRVVRRGKEKFKEQIEKDGYSNLTNREFDKYWEYLMKISKKRVYNEITGFIPSSKIMPWGLFKRTPPSSKKTPETGVSSYKNTPESGNSNNVKNTLNTSVSTSVKKTKKISKNNTNNVKKQLFNNRYNQAENLKNKYREYLRDKSVVRIIRNYQNNTKTGFFGKSKFPTLNNANKAIQNRINIIKISNSVRNQFNNDKNRNIVNRVLNNLETGKSGLKTEVQVIGKISELLTQKNQNEPAKINAKNTPETGNNNNVKNTLNTSVSTSVKKTKKISKNNTNNVKKQLFNNRYNQAENLKNKYREYLRDKSVVRIIRNYQNNTKTGFFGKRKFPTLNNANKAIQNRINIIKISNSVRNQFNNDKNRNIVNRVLNNLETGKSGLKTEVQVIGKISELLTQKNQNEPAKINAKNTPETGNSNNVKNTLNTSVSTSVKKTKKISKNNTNNVKKQLFNNRYNQAENLKNKYREYLRDKSVVRIIRNYQNNTKTGFFGKSKFPTLNNANKAIQNRINIIKISNSVRNQFNNDKNRNIVNRVLNNLETGKSGLKTEVQVIVKINELLTQKKQTEAAKINAQRKAEENAKKKNVAEAAKANAQRRKNEAAIGKAIFKQKKIETETEIQRIKNETVTKIYRGYSTELNNVSNLNQLENIHRRYKKSKISKVLKQKLNKKYKNKKLELNSNSTRKRSSGGIFGSLFGKKRKNKNNSNNNIYYNNTSNETDEKNTLNEKIQRTRNKFKRTRNKFQDTGRKIGKIFFKKEKKEKVPNKTEIRVEGRDGQAVYLRLIREVREVENSEQQLKALRREGILRLHPNKNPGFT